MTLLGLALAAASAGGRLAGSMRGADGGDRQPVGLIKWTRANCTKAKGHAAGAAGSVTGCGSKYVFGDTPRATAGARNDTLRCDLVFDGSCHHLYRDAFWHRMVDCLVPSYAVLTQFAQAWGAAAPDRKAGVCLMLHVNANREPQGDDHPQLAPYADFVTSVLPLPRGVFRQAAVADSMVRDPSWRQRERELYHAAEIFAVRPHAVVTTWAPGGSLKRRGCSGMEQLSLRTLRSVLLAQSPAASAAADVSLGKGDTRISPGILLIRRQSDERAFGNFDAVRAGIQRRVPEAVISTYWGNESLADTAALFNGNGAVIGYHGAGLVNTLFSTERSLVVEVTTTFNTIASGRWAPAGADSTILAASGSPTKLWRTNDALATCNQMRWQSYLVPHRQLGFSDTTLDNLQREKVGGRHVDLLRRAPAVTLTKPDLDHIASVIRDWFEDGDGMMLTSAWTKKEAKPAAARENLRTTAH